MLVILFLRGQNDLNDKKKNLYLKLLLRRILWYFGIIFIKYIASNKSM